jgi:hypothetical protein
MDWLRIAPLNIPPVQTDVYRVKLILGSAGPDVNVLIPASH